MLTSLVNNQNYVFLFFTKVYNKAIIVEVEHDIHTMSRISCARSANQNQNSE